MTKHLKYELFNTNLERFFDKNAKIKQVKLEMRKFLP